MGFKMSGWSAFTKTIAKNAGIDPIELTDKEKKRKTMRKDLKTGMVEGAAEAAMHTGSRDFEPAWEGADISKQRWDSMSKKEKDAYTEKYGD